MALQQRKIDVTFTLASAPGKPAINFAEGGNTLKLSDLRVSAKIIKAGGVTLGSAELRIYGMTFSHMNKLSTLGMQIQLVPWNTVTIEASDSNGVPTTVFYGSITNAYGDFQSAPDVGFFAQATILGADAIANKSFAAFDDGLDVASILAGYAKKMNLTFENNGVNITMPATHVYGSYRDQVASIVQHANIMWNGGDGGVLAIWPKNGTRNALSSGIPLVSPTTGMIGYPSYTAQGIVIKTIFNPAIAFGREIQVQSSLPPANGNWTVSSIDHTLESEMPGGQWFTTIQCYNPKFGTQVVR